MGGFFAATLKNDCVFDLFFGTDYHSHLGTRRAGMTVLSEYGFERAIHNIENSPFRSKFDRDVQEMKGNYGIGCISDYEPQPLIVRSHHGTFSLVTVGRINNAEKIVSEIVSGGGTHFLEMSGGVVNQTELVASLINQKDNLIDGIKYVWEKIDGSMTMLILTPIGIYCARDLLGRTPIAIGKKEEGYCASFESFAYLNLGYEHYKELGPGEIDVITPEGVKVLVSPNKNKKICSFLWVYFGYPSSGYEGVSVEAMRNKCGSLMAKRDNISTETVDIVAGVPDSGIAHAVGYANKSGVPFSRPYIKYTPKWHRSFIHTIQEKRDLIAKKKIIPVHELIDGQRILLIDDSIVRGTQLRETTEFLYKSGAKEVHVRPACPPIMYGCKYINFSRSTSDMDLITRRIIRDEEGEEVTSDILEEYANPDSEKYKFMVDKIREQLGFTSLSFNRLDDMVEAIGIGKENLCTYCFDGQE